MAGKAAMQGSCGKVIGKGYDGDTMHFVTKMGRWGAGRSQQEKDFTSCLPLLSRIRSMRGGVAGEGIWLRYLRTSAAGGGKKGRAGELAQAAGTTGAHGPWSPSHFRSGPRPWQALEQSFPPECQRGQLWLKFLSVFWNTSAPTWESRLQKWPPGPREIGLPPLPVPVLGGPTCPPLRSRELVFSLGRNEIPSW